MTVAAWPVTIPDTLLRSGYSQSCANVSIRTEMDVGPAKVRRRATAGVQPVQGQIELTTAQLGYLRTFYNTTLLGGSLRFSWKDPITEASAELRFVEPPSWTAIGIDWQVSLKLEILP